MTGLLLIETFMSSNNILFTISDALCKTYCSLSSGNFVCFFFSGGLALESSSFLPSSQDKLVSKSPLH